MKTNLMLSNIDSFFLFAVGQPHIIGPALKMFLVEMQWKIIDTKIQLMRIKLHSSQVTSDFVIM